MDPITYPTVTLEGKAVAVKFRCGDAIRLLAEHQIDIFSLSAEQLRGAAGVKLILTLLAAGVSHQATYTVEQLGDMIDLAELRAVDVVIGEAIKKAFPAAVIQPTQPTPAAVQ